MTVDGGRNWQPKTAPPVRVESGYDPGQNHTMVNKVYFATDQDGWLFGPGFYFTHDGGTSWQAGNFPGDIIEMSSADNKILAVTRTCAQPGIITGCDLTLLSSTDNGHSWQKLPGFPALAGSQARLLTLTPNDFWLLSSSPEPGPIEPGREALPTFVVTHDEGKSWQKLNNPVYGKGCANTGLAAADLKEFWLVCGTQPGAGQQLKYLYRSGDGGQNWTALNSKGLGGGGYLNSLAASGPGKLWIALGRGTLITCGDGGQTWNPAIPYEQANPGDGGVGPVVFADASHGWLAAAQGRVFLTVDGGATWQPVELT